MADVQIAVIDQQNTEVAIAVPGIQGPVGQTGDVAVAQDGTAAQPGIRFENDTNTGIYRPGADQVAVATNGVGRLFVDGSGNVLFTASVYSGSFVAQTTGDTYIAFRSGVGAPGSLREARIQAISTGGGGNGHSLAFLTNVSGGAPTERLRITSAGQLSHIGGGGVGAPAVGFNGSAPSNSLVVDSTGRVGIGTSSPTDKLSVIGGDISVGESGKLVCSAGTQSYYLLSSGSSEIGYQGTLNFRAFNAGSPKNALYLSSAGNVGIGTTGPAYSLDVSGSSTIGSGAVIRASRTNAGASLIIEQTNGSNAAGLQFQNTNAAGSFQIATLGSSNAGLFFYDGVNNAERARIDSSGRLLVGTSTARAFTYGLSPLQQIEAATSSGGLSITTNRNDPSGTNLNFGKSRSGALGGVGIVSANDGLGTIRFEGADGTKLVAAAEIFGAVDGTPGANDMPGRLVFSTTADGASAPTERMRITSGGVMHSQAYINAGSVFCWVLRQSPGATDAEACAEFITSTTLARYHLAFRNGASAGNSSGAIVGSISTSGSSTSYTTSSDYRLKENVTGVTDGITRLQQLKPSRFNFIADPDKTVDGFLAHEVQTIVPEAITGEKDAVDDDGNPIYQGIDQSKLVPLLTAALQEAIGEIESLKARLTAAGI